MTFLEDFPGKAADLFTALVTLLPESRTNILAFTFQAKPIAVLHRYFELDNESYEGSFEESLALFGVKGFRLAFMSL
jgi:hypothetical protein